MMKRRSFLALLGLVPLASLANLTAAKAGRWTHDHNAWVWVHSDGRFVTDRQLIEAQIATAEEYCAIHNITVVRKSGDYNILSNGMGMHVGMPERITYSGSARRY